MILITRPKNLSKKISKELAVKNIKSITQPLFSIIEIDNLETLKIQPQAILITSSSAIFSLKKLNIKKETLIISVGKATSSNLNKLGYNNIITALNNSASLLKISLEKLNKDAGEIIYLSGKITTLDLAKKLENNGFNAKRIIVYKTKEVENFSQPIIKKIQDGEIREVWLYSKNSEKIFHKLIKKHNLVEYLNSLKLVSATNLI